MNAFGLRSFLVIVVLAALVSVGGMTTPSYAQSGSSIERETKLEIAKFPSGEYLYRESDLFERMINYRVMKRLGIIPIPALQEATEFGASRVKESGLLTLHPAKDLTNATTDQNEPSIAISRKDSKIIIAGANDDDMFSLGMPCYLTTNEGVNWQTVRLPHVNAGDMTAGGDPMIVSDDLGTFYYAFLIFDAASSNHFGLSDIQVGTSPDGKSWNLTAPVVGITKNDSIFEDKEAIAVDCDPASPHYHRIYVQWTHFDLHDAAKVQFSAYLAYSDDKGLTWKHHPIPGGRSAQIRVGAGGKVFIASDLYNPDGTTSHVLNSSTDGGATFATTPITDFTLYPLNLDGRPALKGQQGFRVRPYISFDIDNRDNTIHLVYGDYDASQSVASQLYTVLDANGNWSDAVNLGKPTITTVDRFLPWVTFDQATHQPYASYYSSEEDPTANVRVRLVRTPLWKVDSVEKIGARLFNPNLITQDGSLPFIGDYICADAFNGTYATAWTENKSGASDGEIFAYINSADVTGVTKQLDHQGFYVGTASPNPASGNEVSFTIKLDSPRNIEATILDGAGRILRIENTVLTTGGSFTLNIASLPAGDYFCKLSDGFESVVKSFVIVR